MDQNQFNEAKVGRAIEANAPQKEGEIAEAFQDLHIILQQVEKATELLRGKITIVLSDSQGPPMDRPIREYSAPLAKEIQALDKIANNVSDSINDMIQRIEL